jgi:hypothetical protein
MHRSVAVTGHALRARCGFARQWTIETTKTTATANAVVVAPFQVSHDGVIHRPGGKAEVPEHAASYWLSHGWVKPASERTERRRRNAGRL